VILGTYDKASDRYKNDMKSELLPPKNPLEIWKNKIEIYEELQGIFQLRTTQLEFLETVASAICGYP